MRALALSLALVGAAVPVSTAHAQPKASQSVVHVRVFEGPN